MVSDIHDKGFSLIELLVVCVVILGITGLAISNYASFTDTQKVKQTGRTLKNNLRFIQTRATSGLKPRECDDTNPLLSYRITFTASTYTYQPVCANGIPQNSSVSFSLPAGVTFSPIPRSFDFMVLTGTSTATVDVTITGLNKQYRIQVANNGNIEDVGFL
jgi:prepilin-type N-terminal cleavage/methylation domain-containing protein